METLRTSETSVNTNLTTRPNIPEDSKLHTRRRENLKSRIRNVVLSDALRKDTSKHVCNIQNT
jgi:hypothetical protein